jgi:hypothetical protein
MGVVGSILFVEVVCLQFLRIQRFLGVEEWSFQKKLFKPLIILLKKLREQLVFMSPSNSRMLRFDV